MRGVYKVQIHKKLSKLFESFNSIRTYCTVYNSVSDSAQSSLKQISPYLPMKLNTTIYNDISKKKSRNFKEKTLIQNEPSIVYLGQR